MWQEFANKYIEELEKPPKIEIEPPISHYMENYSCGGFKVTDNLLERLTPEVKKKTDLIGYCICTSRLLENIRDFSLIICYSSCDLSMFPFP